MLVGAVDISSRQTGMAEKFSYRFLISGWSNRLVRPFGSVDKGVFSFTMPGMAEARDRRVYTARGPVDGEDWSAVAAVLNERMASRRVGQQELAHLSGVSVSTLRQVQHGAGRRVQNKTLTAISRALDWPEDHLSSILLGRHLTPRPTYGHAVDPGAESVETMRRLEAQLGQISERLAVIERVLLRNGD
jgi:DNA-binding Xre family transcriptional regulator